MHLVEALIEAVTGNNWHNCSWNGRTGRFCQENGPSTCATYSGDRTSEVYFAGKARPLFSGWDDTYLKKMMITTMMVNQVTAYTLATLHTPITATFLPVMQPSLRAR